MASIGAAEGVQRGQRAARRYREYRSQSVGSAGWSGSVKQTIAALNQSAIGAGAVVAAGKAVNRRHRAGGGSGENGSPAVRSAAARDSTKHAARGQESSVGGAVSCAEVVKRREGALRSHRKQGAVAVGATVGCGAVEYLFEQRQPVIRIIAIGPVE